jgi:hypothetical protein
VWGLRSNPASEVEKPPLQRSGEIQVFSPEEVWALVRAAASEQDAAIYLTAAFTGLRLGELLALSWRDVHFPGSVIRVRASYAAGALTTPKSGKVRSVPVVPDVASALAQLGQRKHWTGDEDLVFAGPTGRYLDGSGLRKRYKAALAASGLRALRFHDLRHTFGTRMIAKADIVACRSGWATPISRPRCATCTTPRVARTRSSLPRHSRRPGRTPAADTLRTASDILQGASGHLRTCWLVRHVGSARQRSRSRDHGACMARHRARLPADCHSRPPGAAPVTVGPRTAPDICTLCVECDPVVVVNEVWLTRRNAEARLWAIDQARPCGGHRSRSGSRARGDAQEVVLAQGPCRLTARLELKYVFPARDESPSGTDARSPRPSPRASTSPFATSSAPSQAASSRRACSEPSTDAWPSSARDGTRGCTSPPPSRRRSSRQSAEGRRSSRQSAEGRPSGLGANPL